MNSKNAAQSKRPKMKFGILQFFTWPGQRVSLQEIYQRAFERCELMDKSGYDAVWLAEHHFTTHSVSPSSHMLGAVIAERTKHLRIGTAVSLAPFYNPLRLAEEIALLDVLSNGRVSCGLGRAHQPVEFKAFGVKIEDSYALYRENVEIVQKAWSNERLTFHGKFHQYDDVLVLPKPIQDPMPVWLAGASAESINWAAERGYSTLMAPPLMHNQIGEKHLFYQDQMKKHGHNMAGRDIPIGRLICVDETKEKAAAVARAGARWYVGSYSGDSKEAKEMRPVVMDSELNRTKGANWNVPLVAQDVTIDQRVEQYMEEGIIWGTPEMVIDQIEQLREEIFLDYLMLAPLSHQTILSFTDRVMPHFQ